MESFPDAQGRAEILRSALRSGLITEDDTATIFYDLTGIKRALSEITALFPAGALHTLAIKANPLPSILAIARQAGFGAEAASWPELHIAGRTGFSPDRIVFDSPVKTVKELRDALVLGVHINADSLAELDRIAGILDGTLPKGPVGIRLNPQVGTGKILSTSVGGRYSKFGVPLTEEAEALRTAFRQHPWLNAVHVHVGSQGCPLELLLAGVRAVTDFVTETNGLLQRHSSSSRINLVDIGGGLPVQYRPGEPAPTLSEYVDGLRAQCPALFSSPIRLVTEFGRAISARCGWAAARVEYVKRSRSGNTLLVHLGADMFVRRCYNPGEWYHGLTLVDADGNPKSTSLSVYSVGGPLCFGGDMLAREAALPEASPGDYLLIHDSGAYTLSMWSRYNSRQIPKVLGHDADGGFRLLKERETVDDVWRFWS